MAAPFPIFCFPSLCVAYKRLGSRGLECRVTSSKKLDEFSLVTSTFWEYNLAKPEFDNYLLIQYNQARFQVEGLYLYNVA